MRKLRIHYLQHVPFESLGYIETWAKDNGHILSATKFYKGMKLPQTSDYDWLIVMGGPMGVYEEDKYAWLSGEKACIKSAIAANKTVIGICLGAQLIAEVLGAKVYRSEKKEIGWFPVYVNPTCGNNELLKDIPSKFPVLHWHGDTFELPKKAIHLMKTEICANQAFLYKDNVLGLQFHMEATTQTLQAMIENCSHELVMEEYVQGEDQIIENNIYCKQTNQYLKRLLDRLTV